MCDKPISRQADAPPLALTALEREVAAMLAEWEDDRELHGPFARKLVEYIAVKLGKDSAHRDKKLG